MISLIWNCQGAASGAFRRTFNQFVRLHKPAIVCLLEPKVSGSQANGICSCFGFSEWVRIEAIGFSGGIWLLSVVYGSPNMQLRRKLFADLSSQDLGLQGPWLSVGDFNSVLKKEEVSNSDTFNTARCTDFSDWIFREGLIDLGFTGSPFTWMRGINTTTFKGARLDRALANGDWRIRFPEARVEHLPMIASDHCPLLIDTCASSL
ncbi:PREDICTED: uncharacterized protein LOC109181240 [Ipomoea nil]|uniref:uncharacterized protein LOC109181240 n=1 Tax=Ipomoea nil TaxID=35883 RepID=UPI000901904A|nr:PREDICTED: uncharacterized protein LOC109181240 [Ipomoea nil]